MRKAALYGLILACVCMLSALSGPSAQKIAGGDGGGSTSNTVPVSVANFPQVQPVQVQKTVTVTGSVAVTNLPLDAEENLRVSSGPPAGRLGLRFVGITQATFSDAGLDGVGELTLTRACGAEFPATRLCQLSEILLDTIPGPPEWPGLVRVTGAGQILATGGGIGQPSACLRSTGLVMDCSFSNDGPGPWPAACCGN